MIYRRDIDGLRAVAVLPVVLGHAGIAGFSGGYVGVDVFFVISGFLITGILVQDIEKGAYSILKFYERRARRILPALFTVIAFCLIVGWFLLTPGEYDGLAESALSTLFFVSNFWFWSNSGDYFGTASELQPLLHTWSLGVEEQFYIAYPLLLGLLAARGRRAFVAVIAAISLLSFALSVWATSAAPFANFFLIPTRMWELGLGALLSLGIFPHSAKPLVRNAVAAAGLALILASVVFYSPTTPFPGIAALAPCLGAAAIIWAGGQGQSQSIVGRLLSTPVAVWFGLISYSLYLWHWPLIVAMRHLEGSVDISLGAAAIAMSLATLLAYLSWRFVERPFRRMRAPRNTVFSFSLAGAAVLAAMGGGVIVSAGAEVRMAPDVLESYRTARERSVIDQRCHDESEAGRTCAIGAPDAPDSEVRLFVWGDSHAASLLPGFEAWLAARGEAGRAAIKNACPPLIGVDRTDGGPGHHCDRFNDDVIAYLEQHPQVRTVVLVARWALTADGARAPGEAGLPAVLADRTGAQRPGQNREIFRDGLQRTVERLSAMERHVIVIEGIPEIGFSVPEQFLRREMGLPAWNAPPSRVAYNERNRSAAEVMGEVAATAPFEHLGLADILCPDQCRIEDEGGLLYRDDNHLSTHGAIEIVPALMAARDESML